MTTNFSGREGAPETFLNTAELSRRWGVTAATIRNWRWRGDGCAFVKLGSRVAYRLSDVERFEQSRVMTSTSQAGG